MIRIQPKIENLAPKKLLGINIEMSLAHNLTGQLWQSFMKRRDEIINRSNTNYISLQFYEADYFKYFNPNKNFTKWATVEVTDFDNIPIGMNKLLLSGGLYAVFNYKGNNAPEIFQYIFTEWLPQSNYNLDDRPHFEILGERYNNDDPESEEDIYIPIQMKKG